MPTSTLTSKGQITVPKAIREHLHVAEGDQVDFAIAPDGTVNIHRISSSVAALAGMLHQPRRRPISLDEMNEAITSAATDANRVRR